jgi:hypothetical protein
MKLKIQTIQFIKMTILSMSGWRAEMATFEKINWLIAIPFTALFLIQLVLTFVGGDVDQMTADGDADATVEGDTGIDFQFLTLKNLIAFFTIFGWTGIICIKGGLNPGVSVAISVLAGLIMMTIMASLMYFMGKLTQSGSLNIRNAVGKTCTVYLTIPANMGGLGKVQIQVQGFQTLDAMTDHDEKIPTGSIVVVKDVINNEYLLVKPIK